MIIPLYEGLNHSEYLEIEGDKARVVINGDPGVWHQLPVNYLVGHVKMISPTKIEIKYESGEATKLEIIDNSIIMSAVSI